MVTPFLVVVAASVRKMRTSPRPCSLRATLKACWKPLARPLCGIAADSRGHGFPDRHAQNFFRTVVKISTVGSEKRLV
ncbi:hypothetical protein [Paraburkholderia silvatlantica]|uniref:Secreted protein n=1 Tax=Paraburkholderia silvatlantica TaxID=321895 RepID=A0ABR6FDY1_9BURK|nr:hypothetical protein [Paraburkholderia silvatlantica]MBB2925631.1 hypothetical protein [Paraburkholderia silvatlantica]